MTHNPNHYQHRQIINRIQDFIVGPKLVMIIERKEGKILECVMANSIGEIVEISELPYIARLISLRHDIANFDSILGGLKITVNEFNDAFTFATLIDNKNKILIVITPKTVDLTSVMNLLKDVNTVTVSDSQLPRKQ